MRPSRIIQNARPTSTRVEESTAPALNQRIRQHAEEEVARAVRAQEIEKRLAELDREWDVERALQANFGIVNLAAITLGALVARPFFVLTGIAAGFMMEHALKGWCPPVPVLRRLGFRTLREINQERYALKGLRGDFERAAKHPRKAFEAAAQ